ncbi:MAG: ribosome-associated translation inhibitor RaiA [Patescibacteria group bacterium]
MKINITAKGIELTPAISEYVTRKVSALEKYFESSPDAVAQVEVGKSTQHHKSGDVFRAEVHIIGAGLDLYATSEQADLYAAIDVVKDEIISTAMHKKGKFQTMSRKGGQAVKNMMKGLNFFKRRK